jgi:hypothetical protein
LAGRGSDGRAHAVLLVRLLETNLGASLMITTGKAPHRNDHPVLPSMADRTWQSRSMSNMPAFAPENWHPSGEAERIVPQREVFRKTRVMRPHTPDMLAMQLGHSFSVGLEEKHGRAAWVHASSNPNLISGPQVDQGMNPERLRVLKKRLLAAAYGRGDVEDTSDDWEELFKLYDADGSGLLDFDEFRQVVRKHGRLSVRDINDIELRLVFAMIDNDSSGEIDGKEFGEFLMQPVEVEIAKAPTAHAIKHQSSPSSSSVMLKSLRSMGAISSSRAPTPAEVKAKAGAFSEVDRSLAELRFCTPTLASRPIILPSTKKHIARAGMSVERRQLRGNRTILGPIESASPMEMLSKRKQQRGFRKEGKAHWNWPWGE